jgi:hypothetical protein
MRRVTLLALLSLGGPLLASRPAHAGAPPGPLTVELELLDQAARGAPDKLLVTVSLSERSCSTIGLDRDPVRYQVKICYANGEAKTPELAFDVDRSESQAHTHSRKWVKTTVRLGSLGQRIVVGRLAHADGAMTQVTALVR